MGGCSSAATCPTSSPRCSRYVRAVPARAPPTWVALADMDEAWPMPALFRVSVARAAAARLVESWRAAPALDRERA
jgi:hypothetical protein